jgi:hypothetical protein
MAWSAQAPGWMFNPPRSYAWGALHASVRIKPVTERRLTGLIDTMRCGFIIERMRAAAPARINSHGHLLLS